MDQDVQRAPERATGPDPEVVGARRARGPGEGGLREELTAEAQGMRKELTADAQSIGELASGIIGDLQGIVRGEVQLAKAELREDAKTAARAAGMLAAGAFLGLVGFTFLMLAVAYVLFEAGLDRWLAVGIVAVALLVLAAILAMVGRSRLSAANLKPEQTIESLKEDQAWAKSQIESVKR